MMMMMMIINKINIIKYGKKFYGKTINGGHGKIRSCKEIRLFNNELPIGYVFKINSITIAIESLIEKNNIFYPEIALNHCSYEIK